MTEYYVVRDKNTGSYFRGKGANRWGKYHNQAVIYRVKGQAEHAVKHLSNFGEHAEIVPIRIIENPTDVVEVMHGRWIRDDDFLICINCESEINVKNSLGVFNSRNYCPHCGVKMGDDENA